MSENKLVRGVQQLDPKNLYTGETRVYSQGLVKADLKEPISYGKDVNGAPYVMEGNHRAIKALAGGVLLGKHKANGKFDVTTDPDFRPVSELIVLK